VNSYANYFPNNCASINSFGIEIEQCLSEKYRGEIWILNFKQPRDNNAVLLIDYCFNKQCSTFNKHINYENDVSGSFQVAINDEYVTVTIYETANLIDVDRISISIDQ
jgi:hypothetical protein